MFCHSIRFIDRVDVASTENRNFPPFSPLQRNEEKKKKDGKRRKRGRDGRANTPAAVRYGDLTDLAQPPGKRARQKRGLVV